MGRMLNVAMCLDEGYVLPLAVALASLDAVSQAEAVRVYIAHPDIPEAVRQRLVAPLKSIEVSWLPVDDASVRGAYYTDTLSSGSLYRLLLGELLPPELDRVLYLDVDTLVAAPLNALCEANLGGHVIGAIRDSGSPWAAGIAGAPWRELGLDPATPYFNSGVLLIDLRLWRAQSIGRACLDLLRRVKPVWGDQDALNTVLAGKWFELDRRWNLQTPELTGNSLSWALWRADVETAEKNPALYHYNGWDKPWNYGSKHPRTAEWLAVLDRTSWSGWRPSPPPKPNRLMALARAAIRPVRRRREPQTSLTPT